MNTENTAHVYLVINLPLECKKLRTPPGSHNHYKAVIRVQAAKHDGASHEKETPTDGGSEGG